MRKSFIGFVAIVFAATTFSQQPPASPPATTQAPPQYKNLKVLPPDITREQLSATMRGFTQSLGVRCSHCHVGEEGKPLSTYDFPSDARNQKKIARTMIVMTRSINRDYLSTVRKGETQIGCWTCHRGMEKPDNPPPPPARPAASPAPPPPPAPGK